MRTDSAGAAQGFPNSAPGSLRVLQFTDSHLLADLSQRVLGIDPHASLRAVIEHMRTNHGAADFVIATGDLVHDGSTQGYSALRELVEPLGVPVYCIPGNHDDPGLMRQVLTGGKVRWAPSVCGEHWQLVLLDSVVAGRDSGHLGAEQLALLEDCLTAHPRHHTLVCLHHHPVNVGSPWMDAMALDNPDALFSAIDRHPQVRGVLWGHVHQSCEADRNGVRLIGTPSTCVQFKPRAAAFALDTLGPAYRWLALDPNGQIDTDVVHLEDFSREARPAVSGTALR
jgi:3',5'-cyclic-AMP phosphodiesterase